MSSSNIKYTFSYFKSVTGKNYIGSVNEIEGVFSQGRTIAILKDNLKDALGAMLEANRIYPKNSAYHSPGTELKVANLV